MHKLERKFYKMTDYVCFTCGKEVKQEYVKKKIRCPYCGAKILYKPTKIAVKVKAV